MSRPQFIGFYREFIELFDPELALGYPLMKDNLAEDKVPGEQRLVSYLIHAGRVDLATTARSTDIFTGEPTGFLNDTRTDGVYSWPTDLAYYVERYHLRLPDDFVAHVMSKQ